MQNKDISSTFLKGLAVLRAIDDSAGAGSDRSSIADLSRRTGYDRATVRRLCLTLVEAGLVTQSGTGFHLSPRVLTLAGNFLSENEIGISVQPHLDAFAERLGGEIGLVVRDGDRAVYVAQSRSGGARVSFGFTVGSTLPLLATAAGRMLLAGVPGPERDRIVTTAPLRAYTSRTCMDRASLKRACLQAREAGECVVNDEFEDGICGLAVPVGPASESRAVVGCSILSTTPDSASRQARALGVLRETARTLSGLRALDRWS